LLFFYFYSEVPSFLVENCGHIDKKGKMGKG